jgi:hypothetical protein
MATVTGYTAARIQEIEDQAIVSGTIVGDNLILNRYDGGTIDAGDVRGPQGVQGATGDVSLTQLNNAISDLETQISNSGFGLIARNTPPTSDQTITSVDTFTNVTGASVTFTPSVGRAYKFCSYISGLHASATNVIFATRIVPGGSGSTVDPSLEITRATAGTGGVTNWAAQAYASTIVIAPAGWNVSKTFQIQVYTKTAGLVLKNSIGPAFRAVLTVEDVGIL